MTQTDKTHAFLLQGLQPAAQYVLKFHDSGTSRTFTGQQLMRSGLAVTLEVPNSSELIFIETRQ